MSGRRRSRQTGARPELSPEDRALWEAVIRTAVPLPPERGGAVALPPAAASPATPGTARAATEARASGTGASESGSAAAAVPPAGIARPCLRSGGDLLPPVTFDLARPAVDPLGPGAPGLDRRSAARLRRGGREPEARIDLHGMTAERAHRALDRCIAAALARGQRLVLVITGKGGRAGGAHGEAPDTPFLRPPEGLLRREVPRWLRAGPHAAGIVGIYQAHPRHGGAGAFYVYLKKRR